jgi:hypothetical protein
MSEEHPVYDRELLLPSEGGVLPDPSYARTRPPIPLLCQESSAQGILVRVPSSQSSTRRTLAHYLDCSRWQSIGVGE